MRLKRKKNVALAVVALGLLAVALPGVASGGHVRPKGATPLSDSLVIAQVPCSAPNTNHAPPLAIPSCNPPLPVSQFLEVGEPTVNGAQANFIGRVIVKLIAGPDVRLRVDLTDVRCKPNNTSGFCLVAGSANLNGGPDYTGQLEAVVGFRLTDHRNDSGSGYTNPGTTNLIQLKAPVQCTAVPTVNTIGEPCNVITTANSIWGSGAVINGRRMDFEIPQNAPGGGIKVFDGGSSSTAGDPTATLYAQPGLFVP